MRTALPGNVSFPRTDQEALLNNTHPLPIILAVLGGLAALVGGGGLLDAILGAVIWFLIGSLIVWVIAKVRGRNTTERDGPQ